VATMNVSLPKQMKEWVEQRSANGQYANASDYIRDLIREDQQRREATAELQALIDEGLESGMSDRTPEQIRDAVLAELGLSEVASR
jgi:antitoxin ParD1/3/4